MNGPQIKCTRAIAPTCSTHKMLSRVQLKLLLSKMLRESVRFLGHEAQSHTHTHEHKQTRTNS